MSDFEQEMIAKLASGEVKVVMAFANFLWGLAFLIAGYAIQMLLTPKQDAPKKASLEDFDYPQFEEGTPQTVYFGDCWSPDFFVGWYGNLRTSAIKSDGGKK
jgi:hypothetical protein